MQPIKYAFKQRSKVTIDVFGPLKVAPVHQQFLVVFTDLYTKRPEVMATGDTPAER